MIVSLWLVYCHWERHRNELLIINRSVRCQLCAVCWWLDGQRIVCGTLVWPFGQTPFRHFSHPAIDGRQWCSRSIHSVVIGTILGKSNHILLNFFLLFSFWCDHSRAHRSRSTIDRLYCHTDCTHSATEISVNWLNKCLVHFDQQHRFIFRQILQILKRTGDRHSNSVMCVRRQRNRIAMTFVGIFRGIFSIFDSLEGISMDRFELCGSTQESPRNHPLSRYQPIVNVIASRSPRTIRMENILIENHVNSITDRIVDGVVIVDWLAFQFTIFVSKARCHSQWNSVLDI